MAKAPVRKRPQPPDFDALGVSFAPAPEVLAWIDAEVIADTGTIHNPDHAHLAGADLAVLWAAEGFSSKQRQVAGTAEELLFRCNKWQKWRQEQQFLQWFNRVPRFLITLDASYAAGCDDTAWCALVEHELYHVAHLPDEFGALAYGRDGSPKLGIRGHDVEEFVGVVRRYGTGHPEGALSRLVAAANDRPQVNRLQLSGACGTCLLRLAS